MFMSISLSRNFSHFLHIFSCLHILSISSQKFSSASSLSSPSFARRLLLHIINITVIQTMKTQFLFFFDFNFICQQIFQFSILSLLKCLYPAYWNQIVKYCFIPKEYFFSISFYLSSLQERPDPCSDPPKPEVLSVL